MVPPLVVSGRTAATAAAACERRAKFNELLTRRTTQLRVPAPRQKRPQISPIFISDKVRLHVLRKKDGKSGLLYAQIGRFQNRPASRGACAAVPRRYV
jgi:hypothetical protein